MNGSAHDQSQLSNVSSLLERAGLPYRVTSCRPLRGGRTNRVWQVVLAGRPAPVVVKLSTPSQRNPLFDNRPADEWRLLCALSPAGCAPLPLHLADAGDDGTVLFYDFVPGQHAPVHAGALSALLRRVHGQAPLLDLPRAPMRPSEILAHADRILSGLPPLPTWAQAMRPDPDDEAGAGVAPVLLHRDPIASNTVTAPDGSLILLDWQCPVLGDPSEDIAHATSPGMARAYGAFPPVDVCELLDLYYAEPGLIRRAKARVIALRWRMVSYAHWQVCQGAEMYRAAMELEAEDLERVQSGRHGK